MSVSEQHLHFPGIHPHIARHKDTPPIKVADQLPQNFNGRIALALTKGVGTMWCAYAFGVLALVALPSAIQSGTFSFIQWLSQTFIQLVMLSVIMVGQNILSEASDKRAEDTWKDADAAFHTALQIQQHLSTQDSQLTEQSQRLEQIIKALGDAFPEVLKDLPATQT